MAAKLESTPKSAKRSGSLESKDLILGLLPIPRCEGPMQSLDSWESLVRANRIILLLIRATRLFWERLPRRRLTGPGTSSVPG